jgi:hypothetical protein
MEEDYTIFIVQTPLRKVVKLTKSRQAHIQAHHPIIKKREEELRTCLSNPDLIKRSIRASEVWLYYKSNRRRYLVVVVRIYNGNGDAITAYVADRIKKGEEIWQK